MKVLKRHYLGIFLCIFSSCSTSVVKNTDKPTQTVAATSQTTSSTTSASKTSTSTTPTTSLSFLEGSSYDFGTGLVGFVFEKTLTLNNSGSVSATAISTSLAAPFTFKGGTFPGTNGTCTSTLAKSSSCTLTVIFSSSSAVSASSSMAISYHNGVTTSSVSIALTGSATIFSPQQKLVGQGTNGRVAGDSFGAPVVLNGNTLAVGAQSQSTDAAGANSLANAGAVFIYTRTGSTWSFQQKLVGQGTNGRAANDAFGRTLSLYGDTIAVGAFTHETDATGANSLNDAGAVFVFTRSGSTWSHQQKLVGQGTNGRVADDHFGSGVSLYGDTLAIGANGQDTDEAGNNASTDTGAVFVFTRTASTWTLQQKLVPTGTNARTTSANLASSLSLYGDTLAVSSYPHGYDATGSNFVVASGAVFVFIRSGSTWTLQQKLVGQGTNGRVSNDLFGSCVSLYGDTLAVGAYWQDTDETGANSVSNAGAAFIFTRSGSTWSFQQKLVGQGTSSRAANDYFGNSLSLYGDTLAIGAYNQATDENGANSVSAAGAVFVYTRSESTWSFSQKVIAQGTNARVANDQLAQNVSLYEDSMAAGSINQDTDEAGLNSASNAGAVFVFKY